MSPKTTNTPSELELLILKVLWQATDEGIAPIPVREVRNRLEGLGRKLAHTSVITTLNIMVEKNSVTRSRLKNAFLFAPKLQLETVQKKEVSNLLDRVFDGSPEDLMVALLGSKKVDKESVEKIKKLIAKKSKELRDK